MKIFDRFKPVKAEKPKESVFSAGSGPENEEEKFPASEVAANAEKGLSDEEKATPLVTDEYLGETPEETAEAVEEVREKIEEIPGDDVEAEKKVS